MRKLVGVLMIVLAFAAPQSFAGDQEQLRAMDEMMSGQQGSADPERRIPVQNQKGQELGHVVAMATTDDEVAYFLVAVNGSEGELTPVPSSAAQFNPEINVVVLLDVDNLELVLAPTINIDEVQKLADPVFEREVRSYYEQQPVQEEDSL